MKLDFTRDTFDPTRHFLRVILQQGRVQLDADANEQVSILLHYLQTVVRDLIGPAAGPERDLGFAVDLIRASTHPYLTIGQGRYYVDGILCENETEALSYYDQPDYPRDQADTNQNLPVTPYLVYLDVWERALTAFEAPEIGEVALGGADTAARSKVVWQVKLQKLDQGNDCADIRPIWEDLLRGWQPQARGALRARARPTPDSALDEPCRAAPDARYRGAENQLYRVEIHKGGRANVATFKWSRENGAVVFPIESYGGDDTVILEHLGRDTRLGLQIGDWVEIVDDNTVLLGEPLPALRQVRDIRIMERKVTLSPSAEGAGRAGRDPARHPLLRRWDHQPPVPSPVPPDFDGALGVRELPDPTWLDLEDGIQIQFVPLPFASPPDETEHIYRAGDYWLIPARTASGDVLWPQDTTATAPVSPRALPPHGVTHHYARLAVVTNAPEPVDCRCGFAPVACEPSVS